MPSPIIHRTTRMRTLNSRQWLIGSGMFGGLSGLTTIVLYLQSPVPVRAAQDAPLWKQSQADVDAKSAGCITCHVNTDAASMHPTETVQLGCIDCHGGDAKVALPNGIEPADARYRELKEQAHVKPRLKDFWKSSAN